MTLHDLMTEKHMNEKEIARSWWNDELTQEEYQIVRGAMNWTFLTTVGQMMAAEQMERAVAEWKKIKGD